MGKKTVKGKRKGRTQRKPATTGRRRAKGKPQAPGLPPNIFTVTNADLGRLSPEQAVDLVRELLWAEARRIGLPTTSVNVSTWVDVADGGIDARVEGDAPKGSALIKPGHTAFQIKAGAGFEPWKDSQIRKTLWGDKRAPTKENLGAGVKTCLDGKGTYVLVCTNVDLPDAQDRKTIGLLKKQLSDCGYKNPKVEVWSQNRLIGLLHRFPSLRLKINEREKSKFQTHKNWSQQDDMRKAFKAGDRQREFIAGLQKELRRNDEATHDRVVGDPGIGKTKAVQEATAADDLAPLVLYCDSAAKFRDSELMNELLKEDNDFAAILVVDECDSEARAYIWNKLKHCGPRLKLISIHNETDETGGNTIYSDTPPLASDEIVEIIQEYGIPKEKAERWAEFCSGSPRVAHVIGWNLRNNPEDMLKSPDTVNVWDRYIVGGDDPQSARVQQRRRVLQHLGLFKRFGYGPRVSAEAKAIAAIIQEADSQITWARFQEVIKELRDRKILQGENTLYITPKALHIKLWADWWDVYGRGVDVQALGEKLSGKLLEWRDEMFKYAAESEAALKVVGDLLGERGPFQAGEYLEDPRGADLFLALTEAEPKAALECLKNTIGTWDRDRRLDFTIGRREVVWALERIVIWRDLFQDGARLLLTLGEAETETWGNNASGIFAGLFSPGPGAVAPTEASPEERFPILEEALDSPSKSQRLLALRACDAALESQHFSRASGAERQGLRKEPELWRPKTYGELFDGYRRVWRALSDRLDTFEEEERTQAIGVLLNNARGLSRYQNLFEMIVTTLSALAEKPYADRRKIIEAIERILHYNGKQLPSEMRDRWRQLRDSLVGHGFHSLLERYVGMDLLEDRIDEQGKEADKAGSKIDELASQVLQQPELLATELSWLVTDAAKNGYRFGYALGKRDEGASLLSEILEAQRNAGPEGTAYFLGGYFRAIREHNLQEWEERLDDCAADQNLRPFVAELTCRSGISDRAALRVLDLAERHLIPTSSLRMFAFGGVIPQVSERVLHRWIEFLLGTRDLEPVLIALDLYHFYYVPREARHALPEDLTLRLLTAPPLFEKGERRHRSDRNDYDWAEIAKAFIQKHPRQSLELADVMLEHFGEDGTIMDGFHSQPQAVLDEIAERFPREVWLKIVKYLGPPIDSRAYHITSWLRGGEFHSRGEAGVLPLIPLDELWRWVDGDIGKRAWYLASFVPKALFREERRVCLAREVLVKYGDRDDVRRNLMANFSTEGWSGPESLHYQVKKQWLLEFRKGETNANVKRWIDEYVASIDRDIDRARIEEEREH